MHDMCDTREMCEARKSRSSRGRRASARDLCMRDVWGAPRPEALRAWKRVTLQVITVGRSRLHIFLFLTTPTSRSPPVTLRSSYLVHDSVSGPVDSRGTRCIFPFRSAHSTIPVTLVRLRVCTRLRVLPAIVCLFVCLIQSGYL